MAVHDLVVKAGPCQIGIDPESGRVRVVLPGVYCREAVGVGNTHEEAFMAAKSELATRALIESRGFKYCPQHNPKSEYDGLRFCYRLPGVWSPVTGGVPVGWGFTSIEAARNMLALAPQWAWMAQ